MSESPPPLSPELRRRLTKALDEIVRGESRDSLSHLQLDPEGPYAVAEVLVFDGYRGLRWDYRCWPCMELPVLPPNIRRWNVRKFYAVINSDGVTIDSLGREFEAAEKWRQWLVQLGDMLPDFEHTSLDNHKVLTSA